MATGVLCKLLWAIEQAALLPVGGTCEVVPPIASGLATRLWLVVVISNVPAMYQFIPNW